MIVGGRGNDKIDGGEGQDIAKYLLNKADYKVEQQGGQTIVTALRGNEGTDTLVNIEKLVFADGEIEIKPLKTSEQIFNDLENGGYYSTLWHMSAASYTNTQATESREVLTQAGLKPLTAIELGLQESSEYKFENGVFSTKAGQAYIGMSKDGLFISFAGSSVLDSIDSFIGLIPDDIINNTLYQSFEPLINSIDKYIKNNSDNLNKIYVSGHKHGGSMVERYLSEHTDEEYQTSFEGVTFSAIPYNGMSNLNAIGNSYDLKRLTQFEWDKAISADLGVNKGLVVELHNIGDNSLTPILNSLTSNLHGAWESIKGTYSSLAAFKDVSRHFDLESNQRDINFKFGSDFKNQGVFRFSQDQRVFLPFDLDTLKISDKDSEFSLANFVTLITEAVQVFKGAVTSALLTDAPSLVSLATSSLNFVAGVYDYFIGQELGYDFLIGGTGKDSLSGSKYSNLVTGSENQDNLTGGYGNDFIFGGAGDDLLDQPRNINTLSEAITKIVFPDSWIDALRTGEFFDNIIKDIDNISSTFVSGQIDSQLSNSIDIALNSLKEFGSFDDSLINILKNNYSNALAEQWSSIKDAISEPSTLKKPAFISAVTTAIDMWLGNVIDGISENFEWRNAGDDTLYGGKGNDTYFVNSKNDKVIEYQNEGDFDAIVVTGNKVENFPFFDGDTKYEIPENVEVGILKDDVWSPSENFNLSASGLSGTHYLVGNAGNNVLIGGTDVDYIIGGADKDVLLGSFGDDVLIGTKLANIEHYGYTLPDIPQNIRELIAEHASGWATDDEDASLMYGGTGNDSMYGANDNDYFLIDVNRGIGGVGYSNTNNIDKIYNFHIDNPSLALDEDYLVFSAEQLGINYDFVSANTDNSVITNGLNGLDDFSETIAGVNISGYHWFDEYDDKRGLNQLLEFADDDYKALYKVSNLDEYHAYAHDEDVLPAPVFVLNTQTGSLYFDQNGPRQGGNDLVEVAKLQTTENNRDLASFHANQIVILPNFDHLTPII